MAASCVVITANYGDHDDLHLPVEQDIDVEWLCYTDSVGGSMLTRPWRVILAPGRFDDPNLSAKLYKTCPPVEEDDVIWIDASMEITSPSFAREALAARHDGVAAWAHPRRDCVYDEAEASLGKESQGGKYDAWNLSAQVQSYRAEGYPRHAGLYGCGTIAWDLGDARPRTLGGMWMDECRRWSPQDQLSFPVVARRLGIRPGVFPYPEIIRRPRTEPFPGFLVNAWMKIHLHREQAREATS